MSTNGHNGASNGAQSSAPERVIGRPFPKGVSGNPGGRRRKLAEIEQMLDAEHRNVDSMREVFARLKALALGEVVTLTGKDGEVTLTLKAAPEFMRLYLERVLGPVKDIDDIDLADAPPEVIEWLRSLN